MAEISKSRASEGSPALSPALLVMRSTSCTPSRRATCSSRSRCTRCSRPSSPSSARRATRRSSRTSRSSSTSACSRCASAPCECGEMLEPMSYKNFATAVSVAQIVGNAPAAGQPSSLVTQLGQAAGPRLPVGRVRLAHEIVRYLMPPVPGWMCVALRTRRAQARPSRPTSRRCSSASTSRSICSAPSAACSRRSRCRCAVCSARPPRGARLLPLEGRGDAGLVGLLRRRRRHHRRRRVRRRRLALRLRALAAGAPLLRGERHRRRRSNRLVRRRRRAVGAARRRRRRAAARRVVGCHAVRRARRRTPPPAPPPLAARRSPRPLLPPPPPQVAPREGRGHPSARPALPPQPQLLVSPMPRLVPRSRPTPRRTLLRYGGDDDSPDRCCRRLPSTTSLGVIEIRPLPAPSTSLFPSARPPLPRAAAAPTPLPAFPPHPSARPTT